MPPPSHLKFPDAFFAFSAEPEAPPEAADADTAEDMNLMDVVQAIKEARE